MRDLRAAGQYRKKWRAPSHAPGMVRHVCPVVCGQSMGEICMVQFFSVLLQGNFPVRAVEIFALRVHFAWTILKIVLLIML